MPRPHYWVVVFIFLCSGCAGARHVVPLDSLNSARIFGMQDIRAFSGIPSDAFKNDFLVLLKEEEKESPSFLAFTNSRTYPVLAISGGAANGAYGAGLLSGWSQHGTRPVFKVVTGISTGAITAPYAFLGSDYDEKLKEIYTRYSTKDIMRVRFPRIRIPFSDSIGTTQPLERLIEKYFDAAVLKEIAVEYNKGRRLYVGTTNLDAQRLVIWDMGKIASMGDERALKLFRKIILASASVPVAFPPVFLYVEANGKMYDEMHVDGGISKQVFFLYDVLEGFDKALKERGIDAFRNKYAIYIIRNGYVEPFYKGVQDKLLAIAERTVDAMTNAQGIGDLYQIYVFTKDGKGDFNLAYIPASHVPKAKELFDQVEMRELFELGSKEGLEGYHWKKSPPGMGRDSIN
ncbi:MAG: patatin-like phospholipase family protein [Candidatus Omnitrophota bacterium]